MNILNTKKGKKKESEPQETLEPITPEEELMIQNEFEGLLEDYKHTRNGDKAELLKRAFEFAKKAHGCDRRRNGLPYICHPLAVGRIVAREIGLGSTSICAALLHDVVNCQRSTYEEVEAEFGPYIGTLVRGLTQISGKNFRFLTEDTEDENLPTITTSEEQAENFRNLLLTIADDVRVILVKVADRLQNMRTLDALPEVKQKRIATETLSLYAPIAERLGLYNIKKELEDLGLKFNHPEEYQQLKERMQKAEEDYKLLFITFAAPVKSLLDDLGLKYTFTYRVKTIYSVWRKMQKKHISFDEVYDLYAARIVFTPSSPENEKTDCWRIYNVLTSIYKIHPDRIRDWISHPKESGYQALQVTIMGPDNNWIEVQIRSERMNEKAEEGDAAHWKYKSGKISDNDLGKWMKDIKDILDNPAPNAMDFLAQINLNVLSKSIYVFTTKGELTQLPKEATALDFAFTIHTDIGFHAEAARIDHELKPLNTTLENGQQVEIITSEKEMVTKEWFNWVTTTKARTKIRGWLRANNLMDPEQQTEKKKKKGMLSSLIGIVTKKKKKQQLAKEEYVQRSTTIELSGIDAQGLLNTITCVIGEVCTCNIVNIHLECKDGLFKGYITFNTGDTKIVNKMCSELKKVHGIDKAHIKN